MDNVWLLPVVLIAAITIEWVMYIIWMLDKNGSCIRFSILKTDSMRILILEYKSLRDEYFSNYIKIKTWIVTETK